MNIAGIVLFSLIIILMLAILFCNHWIRKITNNYFFWLVIGAIAFIWVLINRFIPDWINYWKEYGMYEPATHEGSWIISRAFLLDACPFMFAILCISLMTDPSRRAARLIAPITFIGGLITTASMVGASSGDINAIFSAQYIFFGIGKEKCYYIMHALQVWLSVGTLVNTPKSGWRVWISSIGIFGVYLIYVWIVMATTGCAWGTTGLSPNDYVVDPISGYIGEYHIVKDITNLPANLCPLVLIPTLSAFGLIVGGILKNFVFCRWIWSYGNAKSNKWWQYYNYNKFTTPSKAWW